MSAIETSYSTILKGVFKAVNPIKKRVIKTECVVHKFINEQAIEILKNDGHSDAANVFAAYIKDINSGVVWADQDFKSSSHFYNPEKEKGLYGFSNAKKECLSYYSKTIDNYKDGDMKTAMFFLGTACHLIQDMTVPQHVNVNLLHHHRKYEQWVIKTYKEQEKFKAYSDGIYFKTVDEYMNYNSKKAIETYARFISEKSVFSMYNNITMITLTTAQRSTAGFMYKFFIDSKE